MENRQVKKTKDALKKALICLTDERSFESITVSDLCKRANISRSAFYTRYGNIPSLIKEIENDFTGGFEYDVVNYLFSREKMEKEILHIIENKKTFLFLLKYGEIRGYFIDYAAPLIKKQIGSPYLRSSDFGYELYSRFVVDGGLSIICFALEKNPAISAKELTDIIYKIDIGLFPVIRSLLAVK